MKKTIKNFYWPFRRMTKSKENNISKKWRIWNLKIIAKKQPFLSAVSIESCGSPLDVAKCGLAPNSFTTRRTRTISATAKIDEADLQNGIGKYRNLQKKEMTLVFIGNLYL